MTVTYCVFVEPVKNCGEQESLPLVKELCEVIHKPVVFDASEDTIAFFKTMQKAVHNTIK